jgi:NTE family protein
MQAVRRLTGSLISSLRRFSQSAGRTARPVAPAETPRIGLALGGGFARGIAHAGVLEVFEKNAIPIHCIAGVSAGSIVAAAYASGVTPAEIARAGCRMRFGDVSSWTLCRMGFLASERMKRFLEHLLKRYRFEEMRIPLGVLATDLCAGQRVAFRDRGDVFVPIRASCAYPSLFLPVRHEGRLLVDGAVTTEIPALLARQLGATHVISVYLPAQSEARPPRHVFEVVNRCFQILHERSEEGWRAASDLVIAPNVRAVAWDGFGCAPELLKAGQEAALAALPEIQSWLPPRPGQPAPREAAVIRSRPEITGSIAAAAPLRGTP